MNGLAEILIMLLMLTNFRLLGSSRLPACIRTVAFQAVLLGAITLTTAGWRLSPWVIILTASTLAVKGVLLPALLRKAVRDVGISREIQPFVGFGTSVLLGAVLLSVCFIISRPFLDSAASEQSRMLIPGAMFTIMSGMFIIITRKKALTQVLGYLTMENGIYAFGTSLAVEAPFLVEIGMLLDVFVAVFVMGIVIYRINQEFDHMDTHKLTELRD